MTPVHLILFGSIAIVFGAPLFISWWLGHESEQKLLAHMADAKDRIAKENAALRDDIAKAREAEREAIAKESGARYDAVLLRGKLATTEAELQKVKKAHEADANLLSMSTSAWEAAGMHGQDAMSAMVALEASRQEAAAASAKLEARLELLRIRMCGVLGLDSALSWEGLEDRARATKRAAYHRGAEAMRASIRKQLRGDAEKTVDSLPTPEEK